MYEGLVQLPYLQAGQRLADDFTWMTNLECPLKSEVLKTAFRWKHLRIAIVYTLQQSHLFLCLGFQHEYKRAWCDRRVEWSNNMIRLTNIWLFINSGTSQTRVKQCIKAFQMDGRQSMQEPQMRKYQQTSHYDSITRILNHTLPSTFLNQLFIMFIFMFEASIVHNSRQQIIIYKWYPYWPWLKCHIIMCLGRIITCSTLTLLKENGITCTQYFA